MYEEYFDKIKKELENALAQGHKPFNSLHEGYAVVWEEMDELWDEIKKRNPDMQKVEREAIQGAAMLVKIIDFVHSSQKLKKGQQ